MALENATTLFVSLLVLGIVGWGYLRARTYGQYGMVAWLQSIVLMVPWLLFFGLSALGIYLNFLVILVLFAVALGIYIYLGRKLRAMGQAQRDQMLQARLNKLNQTPEGTDESDERPETEAGTKKPAPSGIPVLHPIPEADLTQMQGIFGIDTFFCTETVPYQDGAIFRGNLRGEPRQVHTQLTGKLTDRLGDRYRLFLVEGPEAKPVVIVLPSNNGPKPQGMGQRLLAIVLSLATLVTVFERGELQYGFDLFENPAPPPTIIPLFLGLVLILLGHELGHLWMARRRQVRLSWPLFIPAWQLGSFGAITRFESVLPNRETLFDVALAGPAVGGILSFISLLLGLILPPGNLAVQVPTPLFQGSLLVGTLARTLLGARLETTVLVLNPLFIVGWLGLIITAVNLIPAGQLDGGRIVQAIYGRPTANRATIVSVILLVIASFANPLALYWAILIVFLQRQPERPSLEELTEPDDTRAALGLLALFLMLVMLLPLTPSLAGRLGIGIANSSLPL